MASFCTGGEVDEVGGETDKYPLIYAIKYRNLRMVKELFTKGNQDVRNAGLCYAIELPDAIIMNWFLKKGAFVTPDKLVTMSFISRDIYLVTILESYGLQIPNVPDYTRKFINEDKAREQIHWQRQTHLEMFQGYTNTLFATLFLAIQRLEETANLPLADQAMLEEMLECWKLVDKYRSHKDDDFEILCAKQKK